MKIAVAGMGYVGLSNAVLLESQHDVAVFDIIPEKAAMLNAARSSIHDSDIEDALASQKLTLGAASVASEALRGAEYVIVATSASLDAVMGRLDTGAIESVIQFKSMADVIVANRISPEIEDCATKLYSRDIYKRD